eukprot:TRINITY_DN47715_c0_g1_i1.p1 TRINITY_DN47715_c0_g1~~TRINITY_DN47715_c0_g1_i1.p1  ORF type:complete len:201 (-),score=18.74 TRINITY_DN47715_c0_g1_i1:39-641(-)
MEQADTYAVLVRLTGHGTHALMCIRQDSTAHLHLSLLPDGTAEMVSGWQYCFTNDGENVHTALRAKELQGYTGSFTRQSTHELRACLTPSQSVCAVVKESSFGLPEPGPVELRLTVDESESLKHGIRCVRCEWVGGEDVAVLPYLKADGRIVLGRRAGLEVRKRERPPGARMSMEPDQTTTQALGQAFPRGELSKNVGID